MGSRREDMYNNVFLVLLNRALLQPLLLMAGSVFIAPGKKGCMSSGLREPGRLYFI